jgi:hypothetical protein
MLEKKEADRMYQDAARQVTEVMAKDLEVWSKGFVDWAKLSPCIKGELSHDDGELAYFFRPTNDPNTIDEEIILRANHHRTEGPERFLPGRGWAARAERAALNYLGTRVFYNDEAYWEERIREEAARFMEEDNEDEDEAIVRATRCCEETYNNDGEAGVFICCELCSKYRNPDENWDCKYNAWC